jgi:hypothetical protein
MASRPLNNPGKWESFVDVRNKPFHGADHYWKDGANIMVGYWPAVQSLLKEIDNVCKSADRHPPITLAE